MTNDGHAPSGGRARDRPRTRSPHLAHRRAVRRVERRLDVLEIRLEDLRTARRPVVGWLVAVMAVVIGGVAVSGILATAEAAPHTSPTSESDKAAPPATTDNPAPTPSTTEPTIDEPDATEPPAPDAPEPSEPPDTGSAEPPETTLPPESTEPTEPPDTTPPTDPTETSVPPEPTQPPETSLPPDTTEPPETTVPPETTEPPVTTQPPATTEPPPTRDPDDPEPPSTEPPETTVPGDDVPPDDDPGHDNDNDDEDEDGGVGELESEPTGPLPETNQDWLGSGSGLLPADGPGASAPVAGRVPAVTRWTPTDDVEVILATIRELESGGRYGIGPNKAAASGAYQFIPSTWNHYGGYPEAYLAPREIQDAKARADVTRFLAMYDGDVSMVPVLWYYPRAASDPTWMDRVPNPAGGNRLTVRQYQTRWLQVLQRKHAQMRPSDAEQFDEPGEVSVLAQLTTDSSQFSRGQVTTTGEHAGSQPSEPASAAGGRPATHNTGTPEQQTPADRHQTPGAPPTTNNDGDGPSVTVDEITVSDHTLMAAARSIPPGDQLPAHRPRSQRSIVFPVLGPVTYHNGWGDCRDNCARRHEGTDILGVRMQPLLAAVDGTIHTQRYESRGTAGVILSIEDSQGWRYNYFHLNNDTPGSDDGHADDEWRFPPGLGEGDQVEAGQIIGYMGDSGNSEHSVPHLHFEFRDPTGNARPSYWSLKAAEARQACTIGLGRWSTLSPTSDPAPTNLAETVAQQQAAVERGVETTTVTPLYGTGHWLIDTEGRVTATGDAALIYGTRDLTCEPGPTTPHGTNAAGWTTNPDPTILTGTTLEGIKPYDATPDTLPPAYKDPTTNETIFLLG